MSGAQRPGYKPSASASAKATERQSIFFDIKPDTKNMVRMLPPSDPTGSAFFLKSDHYKLKDAEGNNTAMPCLNIHGEGDCPLCKVTEVLFASGDKEDEALAKNVKASQRHYIQAYVMNRLEEGPKLIGLSPTTADQISDIMVQQEEIGEPMPNDPDKGIWISINRVGSTQFNTRYTVQASSKMDSLDSLRKEWVDEFVTDMVKATRLKVQTPEAMIAAFKKAHGGKVDVDKLLA